MGTEMRVIAMALKDLSHAQSNWVAREGNVKQEATPKADKSSYTNEPTMFDKLICFLSGTSYTGGSEFDANGKCQVKGKPIERNMRMR